MNIGFKTQQAIVKAVETLSRDRLTEIDEAYTLAEEHLDVTFKVRIAPCEKGGVDITSDIAFTKGIKVKDQVRQRVDEHQKTLFDEEAA